MPIEKFTIDGYRSLVDLELECGPVTIVRGPNGSGKSNIYRALQLASWAAQGRLTRAITEEGGMPLVLWAGQWPKGAPRRVRLGVSMDDFDYRLELGLAPPSGTDPFSLDPVVKVEQVSIPGAGKRGPHFLDRSGVRATTLDEEGRRNEREVPLAPGESVLPAIQDPARFPELFLLRERIRNWRFYEPTRIDLDAPCRRPQTLHRSTILDDDAGNLWPTLMTILVEGDFTEALVDAVSEVAPGCYLRQSGEPDAFWLSLVDPRVNPEHPRWFRPKELSEGTIRFLVLAAALLAKTAPPFLVLNEPETSLHERMYAPLAGLIAAAAERSQIWLTTHSTGLARAVADRVDHVHHEPRSDGAGTERLDPRR